MATNYLWDPISDNVVKEYDDAGAMIATYTTEPGLYGSVISQHRADSGSRFFQPDAIGSVRSVTDTTGAVTDTRTYSAFGETIQQSGITACALGYVGRKGYFADDATAHVEVRERIMQPVIIRWLSLDPLRVDVSSHYVYAHNSPLSYTDPSGLACSDSDWIHFGLPRFPAFETDTGTILGLDCFTGRPDWSAPDGGIPNGLFPFPGFKDTGFYLVTIVFSAYSSATRVCDRGLEHPYTGWPTHASDFSYEGKGPSKWKIWAERKGSSEKCIMPNARFGRDENDCLLVEFQMICPVKCEFTFRDGWQCAPRMDKGSLTIGTTRTSKNTDAVRADWEITYGFSRKSCCSPCSTAKIKLSQVKVKHANMGHYQLATDPPVAPGGPFNIGEW